MEERERGEEGGDKEEGMEEGGGVEEAKGGS